MGLMEIVVSTSNGVEYQNKDFKYEYLKQFKDNRLGCMFTVLTEQFLPDKWKGNGYCFIYTVNLESHQFKFGA